VIWRVILLVMVISSCSQGAFVKRRYSKGYFVSHNRNVKTATAETENKSVSAKANLPETVLVNASTLTTTKTETHSLTEVKNFRDKSALATCDKRLSHHKPLFKSVETIPVAGKLIRKKRDGFDNRGNGILYVLGFIVMTFFYTMILLSGSPANVNIRVVILIAALMALITMLTGVAFI
jgi:hypothetical protein